MESSLYTFIFQSSPEAEDNTSSSLGFLPLIDHYLVDINMRFSLLALALASVVAFAGASPVPDGAEAPNDVDSRSSICPNGWKRCGV